MWAQPGGGPAAPGERNGGVLASQPCTSMGGLPDVSWRIPYLMPLGPFSLEEEQRESVGCCCQSPTQGLAQSAGLPEPGAPQPPAGHSHLAGGEGSGEGWAAGAGEASQRRQVSADSSRPSPCPPLLPGVPATHMPLVPARLTSHLSASYEFVPVKYFTVSKKTVLGDRWPQCK